MTYPIRIYWQGPGYYSGTSDKYGAELFRLGGKSSDFSKITYHCRERLYDTPKLIIEKPISDKKTKYIFE